MEKQAPLAFNNYYHIYNRANGSDNLFLDNSDYIRFLQFHEKYIPPIADTYAWALLPNHFHLLVRIKGEGVYKYAKEDIKKLNADRAAGTATVMFKDVKWETIPVDSLVNDDMRQGKRKRADPIRHFSHLCNAYARYVNHKYNRHGSLFQRPIKRKLILSKRYKQNTLLYIHHNPVNHKFVRHIIDYPWSSFHDFLSFKQMTQQKQNVLDWFGGLDRFMEVHDHYFPSPEMKLELGLDGMR